jgi:anthranilate synthase component 1
VLAEADTGTRGGFVQRRLSVQLDPFALYRRLGARPDTALFEGMSGPTLLMQRAAVQAECRGDEVRLLALSANGESLVAALARAVPDHVVAGEAGALVLRFPASDSLDAEQRLMAPSPLCAIRSLLRSAMPDGGDPFAAAALGVVAFDYAARGEEMADNFRDPLGFPDYLFWVPETLVLFEPGAAPRILCAAFADDDPARAARNHHDAVGRLQSLVQACDGTEGELASPPVGQEVQDVETDLDDEAYKAVVRRLKEEITAGEVYQIVPSRTFRAPCRDPLGSYAALRRIEPHSYRFFVQGADFTLFGASPETSVRVFRESGWNTVEVRPIAGTRPRGATADEDDRLEGELRLDGKELAEHMMLVDLARNDVARISISGTRRVARLMTVERYARVMHLVSSVTGRLAIGFDAFDALAACLNVGTLTGAPKIRAMQLLREVERTRRGPYGGAAGWVNGAGMMDTAVVIRSAFVRDGTASVRAGAGVVHDSDPQAEADETRRKASALLSVLAATGPEGRA